MKSPFPGMDPYLEQHWLDVHHRLITYACDQLQPRLPRDLRARVEERVFVEAPEGEVRSVYPDVQVVEHGRPQPPGAATVASPAVAQPLVIHLSDEPVSQGCIEIVNAASGNRVITLIEFISPANKVPGDGQDLYLRKQREARAARVSLVEIDLTRTGRRVFSCPAGRIPPSHRTTFQICVRRGWKSDQFEVYRAPLAERLPVIGIPLRETDADAPLDLQALVDLCYQNGRYDDLDYHAEPVPPLDPADAAWANELLRGKGLR
jgi:hypothetical protein